MAKHIFILEDDPSFLQILELRLRSWNPDVSFTHADTITRAREILDQRGNYCLAILDQHLPDGRGHELLGHPTLGNTAILAVSSDTAPELPGETVRAGAQHFLGKRQVSEALFVPLIEALIERKDFEVQLLEAKLRASRMESIKRLLATLRHEINNPLGAVLGGAYLIKSAEELPKEQQEAVHLIEESGKRIKHVIQQLCEAADLEEVTKAHEDVFQVPGDKPWGEKS